LLVIIGFGYRFREEKKSDITHNFVLNNVLYTSDISYNKYEAMVVYEDKTLEELGVMLDNLETIIDIMNEANLPITSNVRTSIMEKFFDNSNGNSVRLAYENLKRRVKNQMPHASEEEIVRDAARWIICISEKYDASKIFKERCIAKTSRLYKSIAFDEDGYMIGVNKNAYYVPQIVEMANLDIPKEAEAILIEDMFTARNVKKGVNINFVFDYLKLKVRDVKPSLSEEKVAQEAAKWLIFISENAYIMLDTLYNPDIRDEYIEKTSKLYKNMEFDERGNYINVRVNGLTEEKIGPDYINLVNSFFRSKGKYFYISGKPVKKTEVYARISRELELCRNKKMVKEVCLKTLKTMPRGHIKGRVKTRLLGTDFGSSDED
jgi:hypothetical protein